MKSLLLLWQKLADESASRCSTSATLDCKTVKCRVEHEGLSFLTITLPDFGKDFQKSLDQRKVDRHLFAGFQRKGELPRFLGGFLDRVFSRDSGRLLEDPCIDAILAVRQLTLMYGKMLLPSSDARLRSAMRGFVECEQDVRLADSQRTEMQRINFRRVSAMLYASIFSDVDRKIYYQEVVPKHGPGSTADRRYGNQKWNQNTWTARLEEIFPAGEFLLPNWRYYDQLDEVDILEPGSELPVRVVDVPKTLKTPRIIGIEPTAMQYMQQAIRTEFYESIERSDYLSKIIGFTDQTPNQRMAEEGSREGTLATLDLSEASDRVSNQLVRDLFSQWPHLHKAVDATRSRKANVLGEGVIRLAKFATMGSALTFPIEAMVFTTLIFMGIEQELKRPLTPKDVKRLSDQVRVYGDDIVCPVDYVYPVVSMLESFGIRVNGSKSYWSGKFRESCGKEYYDGHDVSIVKVRRELPTRRQDAREVISMISLRNQLYFAGYWQTCRWLDDRIRELINHFPDVLPSSPIQGRHTFLGYQTDKMCTKLHRPLVRGYVVKSDIPENSLDGVGALTKWLYKRSDLPFADENHLLRSGRPAAVNLQLRYATPY
uniref:RNA-directed RNA polymerase n=1 Tax=Leviviridae sp. TaxID=2027243 RepID=A0A514D1J4_9VIRU|nr:MAG: RNA-dependent RNA polymerase [Leviviridae sp.]